MMSSIDRRILNAVIAVTWTSAIVKVFGLANQIVIARTFGVGVDMDAFYAAGALPGLMTVTFAAAVETLFVPVYVRARESGVPGSADRVFSTLVNICLLIFGFVLAAALLNASFLVRVTAPGFEPSRLERAISLAPLIYPLILVNVLVGLITSALNARSTFARPNLTQAAVPLAIVAAVVFFGDRIGVTALAAGELIGAVLRVALLVMSARRAGIRYVRAFDLGSVEMRAAGGQCVPVLLGSLMIHSNIFVDQVVASTLPPGQLSSLGYALKLIEVPVIVVFLAFARATLPYFSEQAALADFAGLRESIRLTCWAMIVVTCSMTIGAFVLARPIIGLIFERGRFTGQDADAVSAVFMAGALGFAPMGLGFVIPRAFNALRKNELLTFITVFSLSSNAILDLLLGPRLGAAGIALSTSIVYGLTTVIQVVVLHHALGGFNPLAPPGLVREQWRMARSRVAGQL